MSLVLSVATDFSQTPGPRYSSDGKSSAEEFRSFHLLPALSKARSDGQKLLIVLDGTSGYAASFLEEAFGGLIRHGSMQPDEAIDLLEFESVEEPELIEEIKGFMEAASLDCM